LRPRRRDDRHVLWAVPASAAAAFVAVSLLSQSVPAAAAWSVTVTGSAVGQAAVMPPGQTPTATVQTGSVRLDWAPSSFSSGREVAGYILNRLQAGSTTIIQVCTVAPPFRSCTDAPPTGQQVAYTVVPTAQLWRGPASPASAPLTVAAPALAVVATTPSPTPSPTPTPGPTATPTPTPTATPSAISMPSPTPRPVLRPTPTPTPTPAPS
jgi:hypothetical protein